MRTCKDSVYGLNFNLRGVSHECGGPPLQNRLAEFSLCFRQRSRVLPLDDEDRSDDVATIGTDAKEELRQCVLCGLVGSIERDQLLTVSEKQSSMPLRLVYQQQLVSVPLRNYSLTADYAVTLLPTISWLSSPCMSARCLL